MPVSFTLVPHRQKQNKQNQFFFFLSFCPFPFFFPFVFGGAFFYPSSNSLGVHGKAVTNGPVSEQPAFGFSPQLGAHRDQGTVSKSRAHSEASSCLGEPVGIAKSGGSSSKGGSRQTAEVGAEVTLSFLISTRTQTPALTQPRALP